MRQKRGISTCYLFLSILRLVMFPHLPTFCSFCFHTVNSSFRDDVSVFRDDYCYIACGLRQISVYRHLGLVSINDSKELSSYRLSIFMTICESELCILLNSFRDEMNLNFRRYLMESRTVRHVYSKRVGTNTS